MPRYIDADNFLKSMTAKFKCVPLVGVPGCLNGEEYFDGEHLDALINETPTADVAPRAEVALEVIGEVEKMARDYIDGIMLLDPQNTYCFGGINAFANVIRFLDELKNKYTEATDTNVGHK